MNKFVNQDSLTCLKKFEEFEIGEEKIGLRFLANTLGFLMDLFGRRMKRDR